MSPIIGRPWTAAEDAVIRERYLGRGGPQRCVRLLEGRTLRSVYQRGVKLGLRRWRPWTEKDLATLRDEWGEMTLAGIAQKLGRTMVAVFEMANQLDMELGCPKGREYLTSSARRVGYSVRGLRTLLERSGVPICRSMSRPTKGKKHRPRHFVDPVDVDEAVSAWCAQETLRDAATRRNIDDGTLRRMLVGVPGVPKKPEGRRHWRIPTAIIDRAFAAYRKAA